MPATETTWRDQTLMHVIFGASSLVLMIVTIWMMAVDHTREWKDYQRKQAEIDAWTFAARINEETTADYAIQLGQDQDQLDLVQSLDLDDAGISQFKAELQKEAKRLGIDPFDLARFDLLYPTLAPLAEAAADAREEAKRLRDSVRGLVQTAAKSEAEQGESQQPDREKAAAAIEAADQARAAQKTAEKAAAKKRTELLGELREAIRQAKLREDMLLQKRKFASANYDAKLSLHGIAIAEGQPQAAIAELQAEVAKFKAEVDTLKTQYDAANVHRKNLEKSLAKITANEDEAQKKLDDTRTELDRLHKSLAERVSGWAKTGETLLGMPIADAFYNGEIRIDQIWLPELTINFNFSDVARFDRCISCHRAINKTAPGSASEPAYPHEKRPFTVLLSTPQAAPVLDAQAQARATTVEAQDAQRLRDAYGLQLAPEGLIDASAVTVMSVQPKSSAARAGLKMGDVIEAINVTTLLKRGDAVGMLLRSAEWGKPLELTIRRGLPHPFSSHPRLDLYLGSLSPHKMMDMGCTVCHDGQGSGTSFKWASHTPNNPDQALDWYREHDWFDNHHWIFPMFPKRFIESGCMKCHHEVTELEPSDRYPDPPAPKLMKGFHLVQEYGCFGCHEINGYDGPNRRVGPDLRVEPNFAAAASKLLQDPGITDQERSWARQLVAHPEDDAVRNLLYEAIVADAAKAKDPKSGDKPRLSLTTRDKADLFKDVETPGSYRKVGPSLRFVASKNDFDFLYSWIRRPKDFRPTTRMPQFFRLWQHLNGNPDQKDFSYINAEGQEEQVTNRRFTERYENVEIRSMAEYLLKASQPFEYLPKPEEVTEPPSPERGKTLFQVRGCLACHANEATPGIDSTFGPNLSTIAGKLNTERGAKWLYSWLRKPNRYHVRTKMPDLFLEPIKHDDGTVTDPAADIAAFLLDGKPWTPTDIPPRKLDAETSKALDDLAMEHLSKQYPKRQARQYLDGGIPEEMASQIKGDELALVGQTDDPKKLAEMKLEYVGRRSISKYGCSGCHDIPGFEDAKPIGTTLADWGRKESSKLAFEQIQLFLSHHFEHHGDSPPDAKVSVDGNIDNELTAADYDKPDVGFFLDSIGHHGRQGFLWQKLRMPRSYDFEKTQNKGYNERLRMPQFPFDETAREAVMTFILGLVAEPPASQFLYKADANRKAVVEGRQVIEKYNCAGCHSLKMERWEFDYSPDDEKYEPFPVTPDFPFLTSHFTPEAIEASLAIDRRGLRHAVVHGKTELSESTGKPVLYDEETDVIPEGGEGEALEILNGLVLWRNALLNGEPRLVGSPRLLVRQAGTTKYPAWGGALADYLFPIVIAQEKQINPQVKGAEAWGWLPPPLIGEGAKVQTDWLHEFLLDPYRIRPAVKLRMPKFNMSSAEAAKIANYFAAVDDVAYPYEFDQRMQSDRLTRLESGHAGRLADALKIIVDNNYCVKCHRVGDFSPKGNATALAPNLEQVGHRLRPTYLRDWIANPKRLLPYTGMPVNIPFKPDPPTFGGVSQELFHGTSIEQVDGVVDFLLHYDRYMRQQVSIKPMIKAPPPAEKAPAEKAAAQPSAGKAPTTASAESP